MATPRKKALEGQVRLVCTLPNASTCISDVAFATVSLEAEGPALHLSELIAAERGERFLANPDGFAVWGGDEATHARAIEDALDEARRGASPGERDVSRADAGLRRQIAELTNANQAQARELRAAKARVTQLESANTKLTAELDALKATGARAAA